MDTLTRKDRSARMSLVRGRDTAPEIIVRKLVYSLGYRYRIHDTSLPGCPDLVLRKYRKVIFVHGCFWHRHRRRNCKLARLPKSRLDFWLPKLEGNRLRDIKVRARLKKLSWQVLVVWECGLNDPAFLRKKIESFLSA